ncbi:hypothetical protein J7443_24615 [Tropicibacter sp. R15_0]|uniref:hypothetical protein n=1 Tax=Tropicibacter sp. R15_0 TaxID=2821101 RepID=UPI001ADCB857|nr:hypothetical protein [Tropicibacter sp. R15_0]MBO9468429.1 hypothetical protein [Tropicibacter sp. R15_0]
MGKHSINPAASRFGLKPQTNLQGLLLFDQLVDRGLLGHISRQPLQTSRENRNAKHDEGLSAPFCGATSAALPSHHKQIDKRDGERRYASIYTFLGSLTHHGCDSIHFYEAVSSHQGNNVTLLGCHIAYHS